MGIKIIDLIEAIEDNGLKLLVYGMSGAGKTLLTSTIGQPTIMLSAEGGLLSLKKVMKSNPELAKWMKVIKIRSIDDLKDAYEMFRDSDERLCNWIALDSISEIAEQVLKYEKDNNKDARAAYGNLTDIIMDYLRKFRDLPEYNVLMTAKMMRADDDGKNYFTPMFPGKGIGNNIPYLFDEVFALRVEEVEGSDGSIKYDRIIQTALDTRYFAKDRSGELAEFEHPDIAQIFKKIRGYDELSFDMDEESKERYKSKIIEMNSTPESENYRESSESITDEVTYWQHLPSAEVMQVEAGTDVSEMIEDENVQQISFEDYQIVVDSSEDHSESVEDEEDFVLDEEGEAVILESSDEEVEPSYEPEQFISVKVQYWMHDPSGEVQMTDEDTDITYLINDSDVSEIDEEKYQQITEPANIIEIEKVSKHETKLEKAQREQREKNAAKAKK